ncbi:MAG: nucleoside-diphosphate kinase [Longimicrobiales bacterium]|nr:nucleoside-diphosphate kinase [Longimicrobiales bacterium]
MEQTLAIIKPDATERSLTGQILAHLEDAGFRIRAMRLTRLTEAQAREFYAVHKNRPFYTELVEFMISGPVVPILLEAQDAIGKLREVIGATDPAEAEEGTVRALYAESKGRNSIHASDAPDTARREIRFFFSEAEEIAAQ